MIHGDYILVATRGISDMHDLTTQVAEVVRESGCHGRVARVTSNRA